MLLLALDTSTRQASVALCDEHTLYGEYTWHVGNNHSVELLDRMSRLLTEGGRSMPEIDALAVATGPGSFNGVRVAVAAAKALAFALQKPLIGASTLDIIAAQHRQWPGPICAILEAGRSELYSACYLFDAVDDNGTVAYTRRQLGDYLVLTPQNLLAYLSEHLSAWVGVPGQRDLPSFLFCGEISEASREALYTQMQGQAFFIPAIQSARRASTLALMALERLQAGSLDDPLQLEPMYIRRPSITPSTRKQTLLGSKASQQDDQHKEREEGALRH